MNDVSFHFILAFTYIDFLENALDFIFE